MKEFLSDAAEVIKNLETSPQGLSEKQAEKRRQKYGLNKLAEQKKDSIFKKFLKELANPMVIVLIVAAVVSAFTAWYSKESFADSFIILFVVVLNAVLGVVQESKAEKAIEALKEMTAATSKVLRNGKIVLIRSDEIVPGDVIVLEAGDAVPADARIIECYSLKAEESALTGESVPVEKTADTLKGDDIALGDRNNMVFMGTTAVYGRALAVVTQTGMNTEMGKIADKLLNAKDEKTPLQKKLASLSKVLSFLVLGICVVVFAVDVLRILPDVTGADLLDTFMIAVSLAVAAIPEGLATVVTIVLSIGTTTMSKKQAVIRKLTAVETLGCTQIICSDKTGTLTQNKMTVVDCIGDEKEVAKGMALCSDAVLGEKGAEGEPTECALVNFADKVNLKKYDLEKALPRVAELPFDSVRKMMSTLHKTNDGYVQYTKGALDEILSRCTKVVWEGKEEAFSQDVKEKIMLQNKEMASKALRVLALAKRSYDEKPPFEAFDEAENELTFVGMVGMIDPVRPEVKTAIAECKTAGIRAVMITGDHKDTASAIGRELGILTDDSQAITGSDLEKMSDDELVKNVQNYSVYARVQPEHKVRIVSAWKANGKITAMTGDGVNDAPSLKSADIGVGMGITGTDVTKNVADMVLADDNFATIVTAVKEGRKIYDNIKKAVQFLLSSNFAEVFAIFIATLIGFQVLGPAHLLWINLLTDTFPALALGMESAEKNIMNKPPRDPDEGIFSGGVGKRVIYQGVMLGVLTLASYLIGHYIESGVWEFVNSADGMTMAFLTLSLSEVFHSLNMRSIEDSIFAKRKVNPYLFGAAALSFVLTTAVIYIPFMANAFGFSAISFTEYIIAVAMALAVIPIVEIEKLISRQIKSKKRSH